MKSGPMHIEDAINKFHQKPLSTASRLFISHDSGDIDFQLEAKRAKFFLRKRRKVRDSS